MNSYEACKAMTRRHARTFYFASHTLPAIKRRDAYAVYAFCRYVDDEIDAAPDLSTAKVKLDALRDFIRTIFPQSEGTFANQAALERAATKHPWLTAFLHTVETRRIPLQYFLDLVRGVEMDLGPVRLQTWEELNTYCYHVASVVGLIMVHVVTEPRPDLLEPAADLGRAMQLTNILRDIREDWERDRIYIPATELADFGLSEKDIVAHGNDNMPRFREMMQFNIRRARDYYAKSEQGIQQLPRDGSQLTVWLMRTIYGAILEEIERMEYNVFAKRAVVPMRRKLALALITTGRYVWGMR
ncbi:MAG TPA: phytoene/squalene synthase family protein [Candidatus Methylacidiphilales bacterium]|nr:phytoene/squalene synthase family protein [Candidatus Methylacidiphilales bacterium]